MPDFGGLGFSMSDDGEGGGRTILDEVRDHVDLSTGSFLVDSNLSGLYSAGERNASLAVSTIDSAAFLIGATTAKALCRLPLSVIDHRTRKRVDDARTRAAVRLLQTSVDESGISSYSFIEDAAMNYALDGNALLTVEQNRYGHPVSLTRYHPIESDWLYSPENVKASMYRLYEVDNWENPITYRTQAEVCHIRFPRTRYESVNTHARSKFATPPIIHLFRQMGIVRRGDRSIDEYMKNGLLDPVAFNYEEYDSRGNKIAPVMDEKKRKIRKANKDFMKGDDLKAITAFNAKLETLKRGGHGEEAAQLLMRSVEEIARYYRIPLALLSTDIRQWGASVTEQVGRLAWSWGLCHHVYRFVEMLSLHLLMPGQKFLIDELSLTTADAEGISKIVQALGGDGQRHAYATEAEIRRLAGLPVDPDGEVRQPIETLAEFKMEPPDMKSGGENA